MIATVIATEADFICTVQNTCAETRQTSLFGMVSKELVVVPSMPLPLWKGTQQCVHACTKRAAPIMVKADQPVHIHCIAGRGLL